MHEHQPFKSGLAKEIFEMAIDLRIPGPEVPIDLVRDLELSIQVDVVALALARASWIMAGMKTGIPEPRWAEFPQALRERYRGLAERAIQTVDPQVRLDAKDKASAETAAFIDSTSDMVFNAKTWALIAHEAISRYESRLASLRVSASNE